MVVVLGGRVVREIRIQHKFDDLSLLQREKLHVKNIGRQSEKQPRSLRKSGSLWAQPISFPENIYLKYHICSCFKFSFCWETKVPEWLFVEY